MKFRFVLTVLISIALASGFLCLIASAAEYDVNWDGTGDFTVIQEAIDAANHGDVIVVHPGTYYENIHFLGKNITLRSLDPEDEAIVASTIIDGSHKPSVVRFAGTEDQTCLLSGFTITKGFAGSNGGGGILGGKNHIFTRATITNCVITRNLASATYGGPGGGLCYCNGMISNCTISDNRAAGAFFGWGGGLYCCGGTIRSCTITANSATGAYGSGGGLCGCDGAIINCVVWGNEAPSGPELSSCAGGITYSCIRAWVGGGEGNISDDPLFVTGPLGDYYLSCAAAGQGADSPCIDTGSDSAERLGMDKLTTRTDHEPDIGTVDMGYHFPLPGAEGPAIVSFLNATEFSAGDPLVGFITAHNPGPDIAIDVYIAFILPDGAIISLTASGLVSGVCSWVSNVVLPSGFEFGPRQVFRTTVPPAPGSHFFAAVLAEPGGLDFVGEPSLFPFTIRR